MFCCIEKVEVQYTVKRVAWYLPKMLRRDSFEKLVGVTGVRRKDVYRCKVDKGMLGEGCRAEPGRDEVEMPSPLC